MNAPSWATSVPSTPGVHNEPPSDVQWENLTQDQQNALRQKLLNSIWQVFVQLVTGSVSTSTDPSTQVANWADSLPILGPFITALTGGNVDPSSSYTGLSAFFNFPSGTTDFSAYLTAAGTDWAGLVQAFYAGDTAAAQADFNDLARNLLALLGNPTLNTTTGTFDPVAQVESFINDVIGPTGLLAQLYSGLLSTLNIPGLDASKITSGSFGQSMITGLTSSLNALLPTTTYQSLVDGISSALGHSGTGHTWTDVETYLGIIPGTNIGSAVPVTVIPGLDASKITSGQFAQSMITGLAASLSALLGTTTFQSLLDGVSNALGHTGTGHTITDVETYLGIIPGTNIGSAVPVTVIPGLDASKITSGTFAQSMISGLAASLSALLGVTTFQTLLDNISNALGHTGTGHTVTDIETYLGVIPGSNIGSAVPVTVIPGLDASKIVSGTFAQSFVSGLAASLSALLPTTTYQSLLDNIANAMGQAGTGHTLAQVETYLGLIPGTNIATAIPATVVPSLDASKITTGTFAQSFVTGLSTSLAALLPTTTYQALLDNIANAMGQSGTGHTLAQVESYLGLIPGTNIATAIPVTVVPGLDASKITSGSFAQSFVTGLGSSLAALLPTTTYQSLLDNIANAMGHAGTGYTLANIESYLGLIPGGNIASAVSASVVPGLDASKITSGSLTGATVPGSQLTGSVLSSLLSGAVALGLIPALPASQITSGTLGTGLIPSLDASKITTGTFAQTFVAGLTSLWTSWFGTPTPTGSSTLAAANVAALPASQITSGTFGTGLIPSLDASKITSGALTGATVPGSQLTGSVLSSLLSGAVALGLIPALPASQITSGILGTGQIPALDASKITSGSLTGATVPGGQITGTGVLPAAAVSNSLGGSTLLADLQQLATTLFGSNTAQQAGGSTGVLQNIADAMHQVTYGGSATGTDMDLASLKAMFAAQPASTVVPPPNPATAGGIARGASAAGATSTTGAAHGITATFTHTPAAADNYVILPVMYAAGGLPAGATAPNRNMIYGSQGGGLGVTLGSLTGAVNVFQDIYVEVFGGFITAGAGAQTVSMNASVGTISGYGRMISGYTTSFSGVQSIGTVGYYGGGVGTPSAPGVVSATNDYVVTSFWDTGTSSLALSALTGATARFTTGAVSINSGTEFATMISGDAGGAASMSFGATTSNAFGTWYGLVVQLVGATTTPIGSVFNAVMTSAGAISIATANAWTAFPPNSFPTKTGWPNTNDYTYDSSTNTVTVQNAGTYMVSVGALYYSLFNSQRAGIGIRKNGTLYRCGPVVFISNQSSTSQLSAQFAVPVYCNAGDTITPVAITSTAGSVFQGEATGTQTYFSVALCNRSLL